MPKHFHVCTENAPTYLSVSLKFRFPPLLNLPCFRLSVTTFHYEFSFIIAEIFAKAWKLGICISPFQNLFESNWGLFPWSDLLLLTWNKWIFPRAAKRQNCISCLVKMKKRTGTKRNSNNLIKLTLRKLVFKAGSKAKSFLKCKIRFCRILLDTFLIFIPFFLLRSVTNILNIMYNIHNEMLRLWEVIWSNTPHDCSSSLDES